jgi:alpha/beta hydrolase fold
VARAVVGAAIVLAVLSLVSAATGCGGDNESSSPPEPPTPTTLATEPSGLVIDDRFPVSAGYELALRCFGEGSPVIILESGTDGSGIEEFAQILRPLGERTMTCTYDRPGAGQSDPPSERRRTLGDAAVDLHDLVNGAGLAEPFVLVGASGGGGLVVHYAGRYPDQVAGIVLLDVPAPTGDLGKEFPGAMGWNNPEHLDYVAADRQLARHPPQLGDISLLVVTATEGDSSVKDQSFWLELSSVAEQTTLAGGHDLSGENPAAVVADIESVLDSI